MLGGLLGKKQTIWAQVTISRVGALSCFFFWGGEHISTDTHTLGSDPAWSPEHAQPRGQEGSPVQIASPGQWEDFPGDLDPSSLQHRDGSPDGNVPLQVVAEASRCQVAEEEEKEEREEEEWGTLTVRLFKSDSANSISK